MQNGQHIPNLLLFLKIFSSELNMYFVELIIFKDASLKNISDRQYQIVIKICY